MGLSIAISGGIIVTVLVIMLGIIFSISYQINTESLANTDAFELNNSLKKSKMNIKTIQAQSGSDLLNFTFSNNGSVKFWNYEDFDVFITYDADIGGIKTKTVEQFVFERASSFLPFTGNIEIDNVTPFNGNCDPCNFPHVVGAGSDQIIIVGVSSKDGGTTVSGVTYDSLLLTKIRSDVHPSNNAESSLWYRIAPSTGSNTVSVDLSTSEDVTIGVVSLNNVNQADPIGADNGDTGTDDTPTVDVVTTVNDSWIVDNVNTLDGPMTAGGGQTERWNINQGSTRGAGSTEETTTAGSYTMSWTNTAGGKEWSISAAEIKPSGGGLPPDDFKVQRDCVTIASGTSITLTPPSDYTAPTGDAFVRIANTRLTGNGDNNGGNHNMDDFSVYISDASDLTSQIVFTRIGSTSNTLICYEIIEYIGSLGGDNEFVVLDQNTITYASGSFTVTSLATPIAATDDSDVVVFITGQGSDSTNRRDWSESMSTAAWNGGADTSTFTRGEASGSTDTNDLSYAVIEFIGANWNIERVENVYVAAGVTETQPITDVGSLSRAFLHTQHRSHPNDDGNQQGEEAWISATNTVSFELDAGATASGTAATVAWVISNTQITGDVMNVQHISGTRPSGGPQQDVWTETIPTPVDSMSTTSIMGENNRNDDTNRQYPIGAIALELTADDTVTLTRSRTNDNETYRFSVVEFPGTEGDTCNTNAFFDTNDWIIGSITNDLLDPKIVNNREVGQICTKLSHPIFANGEVQITIVTDLGHVASKSVIAT